MKHLYKLFSIFIILAMLLGPLSALTELTVLASEDPPEELGFFVRPDLDSIHAFNWPIGATVTVTIDDPVDEQPDYAGEGIVTDEGDLDFDLNGLFNIQPGFTITLTESDTVKVHAVTNLVIDMVDLDSDMVSGTADVDTMVSIDVYSPELGTISVDALAADGVWSADFAALDYDILPGDTVTAFQKEQDGWTYLSIDLVAVDPEPSDGGDPGALPSLPHIEAWANQDSIEGHKWDLGLDVTLEVNGEVQDTKMVGVADWDPNLTFVAFDYDLQVGDQIRLSSLTDDNEPIIKTLAVPVLEITDVDSETDLVTGIAEPGTQIEVWLCWVDSCTESQVQTADDGGIWTADFGADGQITFDISVGMQVNAGQGDDDGDYTLFGWTVSAVEPPPAEELIEPPPVEDDETSPIDNGLGQLLPELKSEILAARRDKRNDGSGTKMKNDVVFNLPLFNASGPGLHETPLIAGKNFDVPAGNVFMWNSREKLHIHVIALNDWEVHTIQIYVGTDPVPTLKNGNPAQGEFLYKGELPAPVPHYTLVLDLVDDLGFNWGQPYEQLRIQNIAIHTDLVVREEGQETFIEEEGAWAFGDGTFGGDRWSWWFKYQITHPQRGHFIDSPVGGLSFETPTHTGKTDESGGFDYFPGERVDLFLGSVYLGSPLAAHKTSPLDIFENADIDNPSVINMARLLQSLDVDANTNEGILITEDVEACLNNAVADLGLTEVDFADDAQIEAVIQGTIGYCPTLVSVSAADAQANLDRSLSTDMFRKDISRSPDLTSSKSKLNIMTVWFPALKANGEPAVFTDENSAEQPGIPYYDADGNLIRTADEAKPIVVVYTDGVEETGYEDIFAAISRDDGNTFKRMNIARAADRSSFTLANGYDYFGQAKKPVFQVRGNNILVAWTSKFCSGGKPAYAIDVEDDYLFDDPYYIDDIWGVGGPQRSVDYTEQGFPEVGEIPYSCVWTARGTIVTQGMINSGGFWADKLVGDIVWYKPERLTSGRRDANQVFMGAADGAGFAIAWQEDPAGLRPGDAAGPGPGWGGATTNHKTDIWYSYITFADFRKIDANFVIGGDPEHDDIDFVGRPKVLVPMTLPVRLSDNDAVNTTNLMVELTTNVDSPPVPVGATPGDWTPIFKDVEGENGDGTGTHRYGYEIEGLCNEFYTFENFSGAEKTVCATDDGRLLDGNTGASRPNLFLQTYTKPDGTKSAWAIMAYEESKGAGVGPPDHTEDPPYGDAPLPEEGKVAIYHSFDFQNPDLVSAGTIINLPERDAEGNLMYLRDVSLNAEGEVVYGELRLDWQGAPQLAYENARRPRFILQGKSGIGDSRTILLILYKEGQEGMGRPSDIMLRRVVAPPTGNPYAAGNIVCIDNVWEVADNGIHVCVNGAQNMSNVNPTVLTDSMGEPTSDDPYGAIKVVEWEQTELQLTEASWVNPYDDARAHRGGIRGDFIVMGYSYTPNWAASRNGNDKYDFFVRRSFDGGLTWTTDPAGSGVEHCKTWTYPVEGEEPGIKEEECTFYPPGAFEEARNLSQLPNSKESVIEPRIVPAPGTIKVDGVWTGIAEDKQNPAVFYVSYGTATNPPVVHGDSDEVQEYPAPLDLYYSFSTDRGESFVEVTWVVNPDSDGNNAGLEVTAWDWLAKGEGEQGEAQLRMTPDGSRFYATWLMDTEDSSDIWFRRVMSPAFPANVLP